MKTSLKIDDDVYEAERLASAGPRSVAEILSDLVHRGLDTGHGQSQGGRFPVFSVSKDSPPITLEMVKAALDDDL